MPTSSKMHQSTTSMNTSSNTSKITRIPPKSGSSSSATTSQWLSISTPGLMKMRLEMEIYTLEIIFQLCLWRCFKNCGNRSLPKIGITWLEATTMKIMCRFLPNPNIRGMTNFPLKRTMNGEMHTLPWEEVTKQTFWISAKTNKRNWDRSLKICLKKLKTSRKTSSNSLL